MGGTLKEKATGRTRLLEWENVIGRSGAPLCTLTLGDRDVSGVHAALRWNGAAWEVKDLGSRNGTFLDGGVLAAGTSKGLREGSRLAFGRPDREWELVDARAPGIMVIPLEGGEPIVLDAELIGLPSNDDPRATIYKDSHGDWTLERPDSAPVTLAPGQIFEAEGRLFRLSCATFNAGTASSSAERPGATVGDARVTLSVSREEEFVHLRVEVGLAAFDLGESVYNFLLLVLARRRIEDAARGFTDTSCGWIDREELAHDPTLAPPQLNLAVHRLREQFNRLGLADSAMIVERRASTRQLRIGTKHLTVVAL